MWSPSNPNDPLEGLGEPVPEGPKLMVSASVDREPPRWTGDPFVTSSSNEAFGCGPARHVNIAVPAIDDGSPLFVLVTIPADREGHSFLYPVSAKRSI